MLMSWDAVRAGKGCGGRGSVFRSYGLIVAMRLQKGNMSEVQPRRVKVARASGGGQEEIIRSNSNQ